MHKPVKNAMEFNNFIKAKNFREFWREFDSLIDWNFDRKIKKQTGSFEWFNLGDLMEIKSMKNSYNWDAQITFILCEVVFNGEEFLAMSFHKGGDPRGNYDEYFFINKSLNEFFDDLSEIEFLSFSKDGFVWDLRAFLERADVIVHASNSRRTDAYNDRLRDCCGASYTRFPRGFVTAYESVCC